MALVGGTVIDGTGAPPLPDATVVVRGGRIVTVGPRDAVSLPSDVPVHDVTGHHVLPGLIDVHVHYFEWMGELFLAHGVTTVKDVGNDVEWIATARDEIERGVARGPRIFFTGNGLDVPPPHRDHFIGLEDPAMARRVVQLLHEHGAIAIKVRERMTVELLRPVVEAAHLLGLPVTGHLRATDAGVAMEAGIDGLEHASGIVQATLEPWLRIDLDTLETQDIYAKYVAERMAYSLIHEPRARELMRRLAGRDVALIPTMSGWWRMASRRRDDFAAEDATYADAADLTYVPDAARSIWSDSALYRIEDPDHLARLRDGYSRIQELLREHHDAGGRLLAGSDTFLSIPGLSLQRELLLLVDLGYTPLEVVTMATGANAAFLGVADDLGTVAPGKLADLVVLAADPLERIEHIARIAMVVVGGAFVDRRYHADYAVPTPRPVMQRPLWVERRLAGLPG
jgi:imidazolonepropionase-like amidohydrolase